MANVNIRIPDPLYSQIEGLAKIEHRTMSAMSRLLIEEAIDARRAEAGTEKFRAPDQLERIGGQPEKLKSTGIKKITSKRKGRA